MSCARHSSYFFLFRSLESPIYGLDDIYDNKVVTISYRDPKYPDGFIFEAKRLPGTIDDEQILIVQLMFANRNTIHLFIGAIDPPNVLAPEQRPSNYRPQIGFNRDFPQASLGDSGHRMVNHYSGGYKQHRQQQQQQQNYSSDNRNFASIAPPNNYRNSKFIEFPYSLNVFLLSLLHLRLFDTQ